MKQSALLKALLLRIMLGRDPKGTGRKKKCESCGYFAYLNKENICDECQACADRKVDKAGTDEANNCGKCNMIVRSVDNGLECDACKIWFHSGCEGVNQEKYKFLMKDKDSLWFCHKCHVRVLTKNDETQKLKAENSALKKEIEDLKKLNENLMLGFEELWKEKEEEITMKASFGPKRKLRRICSAYPS